MVDIVRQVLAREAPVTNDGPHYPLPYAGEGSVGLGKPLKPIVHPLRADIPIWLGAEGPKNVAQTAEIADGWIPIFYTPKTAGMYQPWLDEGFARPGARRTREDFEIAATCHLQITTSEEERQGVIDALKPSIALYMGGMGAKEQNFHKNVFDRMGYDAITEEVQELFLAGKRDEATALIPDELAEEMHIVGDAGYVKERVAAWEETGVTTLLLSLPLGRRGAADRRDAGLSEPESTRRAQRPGRRAGALRHRADDRLLPRRLLQHRPRGPRQPHHLRGGHRGVPRPPAQHRQRPEHGDARSTASPACAPATAGASPRPTGAGPPRRRRRPGRARLDQPAVPRLVPLEVLQAARRRRARGPERAGRVRGGERGGEEPPP